METMTFEGLFKLIKELTELTENLLIKAESLEKKVENLEKKVENLEKKVESLEREVTKSASPWVRGWKGASDYTKVSITTLQRDIPELSKSITRYKLADKTFLLKKSELDEFIEGTAVRG